MRRARAVWICAVIAASTTVIGCGTTDDRAQVRIVSDAFVSGLGRGDGRAACAQLSAQAIKALEQQTQEQCAKAITSLGVKASPVRVVRVFVTSGQADLRDGDSLFLDRTSEGWRVSAAGCRPKSGKPADRPFDCALED